MKYNLSSILIPHTLLHTGVQMFRRLFSPRRLNHPRKRQLFLRGVEHLEPRIVLAGDGLSIVLDYSLDTNNFFNDQIRKDT
nr:LEPR-XLL domain-containing protein [Pirellulaceae bacterium]